MYINRLLNAIFRSLFNEMDEKWKSIDDLAENDPNFLQSYRRVSLLFAWKSRSHPSKITLCQNHKICQASHLEYPHHSTKPVPIFSGALSEQHKTLVKMEQVSRCCLDKNFTFFKLCPQDVYNGTSSDHSKLTLVL